MGIPLHLGAALNHLVDTGTLTCRGNSWQRVQPMSTEALTEALRPLIAASLASLEPDTLRSLRAAGPSR